MEADNLLESRRKTMEKARNSRRKTMEKVSHLWVVDNYSSWSRMERGLSFESDELVGVGGFQFRIIIYPHGKSEIAQQAGRMSVCIKNESAQQSQVAFSFEIRHQYGLPYLELRRSLFHDRGLFHRVMTIPPGEEAGIMHFLNLTPIERQRYSYVKRDSIKLVATIAVFVNNEERHQPFDNFIFFQVQDKRYYAEESVIRSRCPSLCANNSEFPNFVLENIEPDTFDVCSHLLDIQFQLLIFYI